MFFLHISNRTENLLRHLAEVIAAGGRSGPFEQELFLIQSRGMERMISQSLASRFGSWCNFRFLLPIAFLADIAGRLGMPVTPDGYARETLAWRIEALLHDLQEEAYRLLARYLAGENADLKRFQLSRRLADIFDQYQIWRPDMLACWEEGKRATDHPSEPWQAALWRRLVAETEGMAHRGVLLRQVIARFARSEEVAGRLPRRVSVFGLHIMPPLFLQYLQAMSRHCDVHLYLLSPCEQYWGDIEHLRRQVARRLFRTEQGLPPEAEPADRHPLLASFGRQGRDFQEMLLQDAEFRIEFESFADPLADGGPSLLHRLQADLLRDRLPSPGEEKGDDDGSIAVVSCHSRLREMEVLREHILRLLHDDPALQLRDIIVMAPDIQEYAPLIPALFADLRHSIADRSLHGGSGAYNAFLAFLKLYDGRFGWMEVLDLLRKDVVYPHFDLTLADLETLQRWITAAGVRWGLSADQRRESGLPEFSENSWSSGLDRLLMGYAVDTDGFVDGVVPFTAVEGGQARALGGLCRFIEILDQAGAQFRRSRSLTEWSAMLLKYAGELFGADEEGEQLELRRTLAALAEDGGKFHRHPVDLRVIRAWLAQSAGESRTDSGFLRGGLTFCSMLPMRSIPFAVVCLLGLNSGEFPRNDRYATFNLMAPPRSRPGDRSLRMDDRYQFLEAMLAARSHLYLSYIGRSIMTNEMLPPSVAVTELLEFLNKAYGVDGLVVEHPLHPFSRRYFSGAERGLFSYDDRYCATAVRLQAPKDRPAPWWSGELAPDPESIPIGEMLAFFANPQRWFVTNRLGIRLDAGSDLPDDREPFAVAGLDAYRIEGEIIAGCLDGRDPEALLQRLRAEGRWGPGMPGQIHFAVKHREVESFAAAIRALAMGRRLPDRMVDCEVGGRRLRGVLGNIYENGILLARYANLKGKDLLAGWLHHLLLALVSDCVWPTRILARDGLITFSGDDCRQPDLERMVEVFVQGCRRPSPLLVEPAFDYVRQQQAARAVKSPLAKAKETVRRSLENGYEPEWALLFRGMTEEALLDDAFIAHCREIVEPIWRQPDAA